MTDEKMPSIADLIAETPGAQPLDQALASVAARRARLLGDDGTDSAASGASTPPEPDDWAERYTDPAAVKSILDALQPKPAQPFKPHIVVDNEKASDDNPGT